MQKTCQNQTDYMNKSIKCIKVYYCRSLRSAADDLRSQSSWWHQPQNSTASFSLDKSMGMLTKFEFLWVYVTDHPTEAEIWLADAFSGG